MRLRRKNRKKYNMVKMIVEDRNRYKEELKKRDQTSNFVNFNKVLRTLKHTNLVVEFD